MIHVIIVDDEALARIGIQSLLEKHENISVDGLFDSSEDALQFLDKNGSDIVITDIEMAKMNGLEFIRKIKEHSLAGGVIISSCHNNFEYAREAMKLGADAYILKQEINEDVLISEIKNVCQGKMSYTRKDISLKGPKQLTEGHIDDDFSYIVGLLKFRSRYDDDGDKIPIDVDETMLIHLMENVLNQYQGGTLFVPYNKDMFALFQFPENQSQADQNALLEQICRELQRHVRFYANLELAIGLSETFSKLQDTPLRYQQAKRAISLCFYDKETLIFYPKEEQKQDVPGPKLSADDFLEEDGVQKITEEIRFYLEQCQKSQSDVAKVKSVLISALSVFMFQVLHEYNLSDALNQKWNNKFSFLQIVNFSDSSQVLEDHLAQSLAALQADMLGQLKADEFMPALRFIKENLENKISLQAIAELSCMSTASFCKKFKEYSGMTFVQYLNRKKIEHVRLLLKDEQKSLSKIAEEAGFCSENYMIRVFKKVTGQTIKEYRKAKLSFSSEHG